MSAEARRIAWNYEPSTPQCCNCVGYRKATITSGPKPQAMKPRCAKGKFDIEPGGCCDKWSSRNGERLR